MSLPPNRMQCPPPVLAPNLSRIVPVTFFLSDFAVHSVNQVLGLVLHRELPPGGGRGFLRLERFADLHSTNLVHPAVAEGNRLNVFLLSGHNRLLQG